MRQLVGLSCVLCGERIGSIIDGRFCESCGCPIHNKCVRPTGDADRDSRCATCGANREHATREQALHQEHQSLRGDAPPVGLKPIVWIAGIIGFAIMSFSALQSTLNPRPDGRLLNTAPAIGVDIFLPIGLLGIGFCLFRLARGR
jgi:hypothetical protein